MACHSGRRVVGQRVATSRTARAFGHSCDHRRNRSRHVANLGDDADTTAAVYGQLAGAYYGEQGIPAAWLAQLTMRQEITELADQLYALSQAGPAG